MTSRRPYLIRAIYDWIIDNGLTPYLAIDANQPGVVVPQSYVEEGRIVLNVSPASVRNLQLGDAFILFDTRFSGQTFVIEVPVAAVEAIYARENGEGMMFLQEEGAPPPDEPGPEPDKPSGRPSLKIVK